jgi:hypothetical protein
MIKEEKKVIDFSNINYSLSNYSHLIKQIQESMKTPSEAFINLQKSIELPHIDIGSFEGNYPKITLYAKRGGIIMESTLHGSSSPFLDEPLHLLGRSQDTNKRVCQEE